MKKLLATAVMMLVAAPVFAADIPNPPPVYKSPPPVAALAYNWSGCYVGVGGGYGMWTQPSTFEFPAGVPFTFSQDTGGRGSFFTAQGGCDFQIGNFVIGAFGDGDWGDLKGTANWFNNNAGTQHQKRSWAAGGRLGYVVFPQLMTFVSGGATQAHFDGFELFDLRTGALQAVHINPQNYDGWFIGSGYEYALPFVPGLFWKTEYRYSQFKTVGLNWLQDGSNIFLNEVSRVRLYEHTVRTELVWRFNWSGPVRAAY